MTQGTGALSDVRVLDFTHVLSGPYCTMMLGDLGADVIKVETIDVGDESRRSAFRINDFSMNFALVNRNKRSVAIDLSTPRGREVAHRLVAASDVVVENFKPGVMERLSLGHEALMRQRPDLIYCSISGYGQDSPLADRGAFDIVSQGMSGLISVTGEHGRAPVKVGVPISDLASAMFAASAIAAALFRRERSGIGEYIDVALVDSAMSLLVWEAAQWWSTGKVPAPLGMNHRNRTPYGRYDAKDGPFIVGAGNETTWAALCLAISRPELALDPRFRRNEDRLTHQENLDAILSEVFATECAEHWIEALNAAGCPAGPIQNVAESFSDKSASSRQMKLVLDNPNGGSLPAIGFPYKLSNEPARIYRRPPQHGEHTRAVLSSIAGYAEHEVESLLEDRIVSGSSLD